MSDLVDRISTVERSLQGSPFTGSDPTRRSLTPPRHALMASAPYTLSLTTPSSLAMERSKTAKSSDILPLIPPPLRRSLRLQMKQNPTLYRTDCRFLNSPLEEEEEEEEKEKEEEAAGFWPLRVKGRPIDKGSVNTTQVDHFSQEQVFQNSHATFEAHSVV